MGRRDDGLAARLTHPWSRAPVSVPVVDVLLHGAEPITRHQRFPASVRDDDGRTVAKTAVVFRDGHLLIAHRVGAAAAATVLYDEDGVTAVLLKNRDVLLRLGDGRELLVGRSAGCGCHSPLKTWYQQNANW